MSAEKSNSNIVGLNFQIIIKYIENNMGFFWDSVIISGFFYKYIVGSCFNIGL